ncbi:hypothetical protein QBC44DRAFT_375950 [Cladorrhinum sp. PSN332]|nr:hypothetical protein QBC44DRAFT_375950 [Cladorrhinum sp. PSN332]
MAPRYLQTRLGRSESNQLTIVGLATIETPRATSVTGILSMPDELLLQVFGCGPRTAGDLVTWLTATRDLHLEITADLAVESQNLLQTLIETAVERMTNLESLRLAESCSRYPWYSEPDRDISLAQVFQILKRSTSLKHLSVYGVRSMGDAPLRSVVSFKEHFSSITSLAMTNFQDSLGNLSQFLLMPAKLERFYLHRCQLHRPESIDWALSPIVEALDPHRSSLRTLVLFDIEAVAPVSHASIVGGPPLPFAPLNLTKFDKLNELILSSSDIFVDIASGGGHQENYLAPSLRRFVLRITGGFGQEGQDWLRGLVAAAKATKSPLQEIQVELVPHYAHIWGSHGWGTRDSHPETGYPWDFLEEVKRDAQEHGILVSYPDPPARVTEERPFRYEYPRGIRPHPLVPGSVGKPAAQKRWSWYRWGWVNYPSEHVVMGQRFGIVDL